MKLSSSTGMLLLGIWLVLTGLLPLVNIHIQSQESLLQILAIAAGAMILMNK